MLSGIIPWVFGDFLLILFQSYCEFTLTDNNIVTTERQLLLKQKNVCDR